MKAFSKLLSLTCVLALWANAARAEKPFVPAEVKAPAKPTPAAQEAAVEDEFEDLLTDEPSEPAPKTSAAPEAATPAKEAPAVSWEVDKEPVREVSSQKSVVAKSSKGPVNQGKLSETLDEASAPKLDLGPVDWDLDQTELPPNEVPVVSEVAVILSSQSFFPRKVHLAAGKEARIYFTTTNKEPAALIIERMNIQRWIAKDGGAIKQNDIGRAPWEFTKELNMKRLTEIVVTPRKGTYVFYDALTGARGEIVVE